MVEQQRQELAGWREELLTTDTAIELVEARLATPEPEPEPEPEAELDTEADTEVADEESPEPAEPEELSEAEQELRAGVARSIALFHLDRCWAEHLATLAEVREGVHLRALGRLDPLDEFHRTAVPAFTQLREEIEQRTVTTFAEADITEEWQPADVNLLRPSATWTYLVHDNPFGSELERLVSSVSRRLTSRR